MARRQLHAHDGQGTPQAAASSVCVQAQALTHHTARERQHSTSTAMATTTNTEPHGARLMCFRPRHRFTLRQHATAASRRKPTTSTHTGVVICGCSHQMLQCRLALTSEKDADQASTSINTSDPSNHSHHSHRNHADAHVAASKYKKWKEKFDSYDWEKQPRVCQKWKDNQKKFPSTKRKQQTVHPSGGAGGHADDAHDQEAEASPPPQKLSPSKAGAAAVKNAITSFASAAEMLVLPGKFDALLRNGVPPQMRGQVWWLCSGASEKRLAASANAAETYQALVKRIPLLSKRASLEIEKDLPRTFPNNDIAPHCGERDVRASSMAELRRVLQAYCLRNPVVGYCQSMNFLAAVLLQHMEEEEAFWVLVAMVEDLIPQYHTKSMVGSRAEQRVFWELVQQKLPVLDQHMQFLGVDLEPFTLKWFLCLFLNTLPLAQVLRIWDVFFCEGSHVLLRIGLTLLKLVEPRILACDDAIDVYEMFKFSHETLLEITAPHRTGFLNRDECVCDTLIRLAMDKSFLGVIPLDSLHELRHLYRNEVAAELHAADHRRGGRSRRHLDQEEKEDDEDEEDEEEYLETGHRRHTEAERELQEYDFVEEYAYHCGDVSPSKHIHFCELYDCGEASATSDEYFVDVDYDGVVAH